LFHRPEENDDDPSRPDCSRFYMEENGAGELIVGEEARVLESIKFGFAEVSAVREDLAFLVEG
jgi:hypothetical protein